MALFRAGEPGLAKGHHHLVLQRNFLKNYKLLKQRKGNAGEMST